MLTRGEFSLILASLALAAGLDPRIGSFTAGYVLVLAIIGPLAVSSSERLARLLPSRLLPGTAERQPAATALAMAIGASSLYQLGTDLLQIYIAPGSKLHGVCTCPNYGCRRGRRSAWWSAAAPPPPRSPVPGSRWTTSCWCSPLPSNASPPSNGSGPCTAAGGRRSGAAIPACEGGYRRDAVRVMSACAQALSKRVFTSAASACSPWASSACINP